MRLGMTVEDSGIEPDFEFDVRKNKEKNVKAGHILSKKSAHMKKNILGENENSNGDKTNEEPKEPQPKTVVSSKKKLKRKAARELEECASLEDLIQLVEMRAVEAQTENVAESSEGTKKKKKKKKKVKKSGDSNLNISPKKLAQSSSEPSLPVEEEEGVNEEQNTELLGQEMKKKKKMKKVVVQEQEEKKKVLDKNTAETKKKMNKRKTTAMMMMNGSTRQPEDSGEDQQSSSVPNSQLQNSERYKELLERLASVKKEREAREMIIQEGKIEEGELMAVLRMWRQQKRRKMQSENMEKLIQMEGTLEELKKTVTDLVRKGKIRSTDAGEIIKRWKIREKRRIGRQITKQINKACFHCRKQGHVLADCPSRGEDDHAVGNLSGMHGDGICFKCGSTEHNIYKCPRKNIKVFLRLDLKLLISMKATDIKEERLILPANSSNEFSKFLIDIAFNRLDRWLIAAEPFGRSNEVRDCGYLILRSGIRSEQRTL
ncbi:zinc knuckle [Necator americanus]|uniref:Zinc knuckle n=1 Tax=Necator americanus TaxID=51031 RepID=W2SJN1_NECAM|nr:zinc knuckle [Necator americanus]ETN69795.1 zinc knuckle [Necator americanus]